MSRDRKRDKLKEAFQNPYRIVVFNDRNLHIIKQVRFNLRKFVMAFLLGVILIIVAVTVLIAFTPLREYIPGYPSGKMRKILIQNALLTDSLEQEIIRRDQYFADFRAMLAGESSSDTTVKRVVMHPEQVKIKNFDYDSLFKDEMIQDNLRTDFSTNQSQFEQLAGVLFFPPINGMVISKYNLSNGHYGVDVVGKLNARVSAALDGTVVYSGWTLDTGYVIYIQHEQNLITVYCHNADLLKVKGDKVKAGEAIAIMGNSGRETTGPHLHFEMWLNGNSVDPQEYIKF